MAPCPYTLTSTSAGTCTITATMAGNISYNPVSSSPTTVTLAPANQAALIVTSTSGALGQALTLATSGGSSTGAVTYVVANGTATGCTQTGMTLHPDSDHRRYLHRHRHEGRRR